MKIGDLFYAIGADTKGVDQSLTRVETRAQTTGQRIGTAIGAGGKLGGLVIAQGLAIAARGAAQLEEVAASFQAATGASAEEAKHAASVINKVAGDERLSLEAVSEAAIKVRRDLGVTGPEADKLTAAIARFARVTKQDAGGAVSALDDIIDGFGLTAASSTEIMDTLLAGVQKFGGSITENQAALGKMAPQLQALNLGWKDGAELLNLFAASGLDATAGQKALNAAITKLPPGESIQEFIKRLGTVTDDGLRAQEAIKVFGAKAGAGLANAIKPGQASLDAFGFTTDEVTGKTDKAAEALDSTFGAQIAKKISQATAALRDFGSGFGPALTGIASLATLAGSIGGGRLVSGILKPLGGLGAKLATKLAAAVGISFASSAVTGAASAGGEAIGQATASGVVSSVGKAGLAAKIISVIGVVAIPVVIALALGQIGDAVREQLSKPEIAKIVSEALAGGTKDGVDEANRKLAYLAAQSRHQGNAPLADYIDGQIVAMNDAFARGQGSIGQAVEGLNDSAATHLASGKSMVTTAAGTMASGIPGAVDAAGAVAATTAGGIPAGIADAILAKQSIVGAAFAALKNQAATEMGKTKEIAYLTGVLTSSELAHGLRDKRPGVRAEAEATRAAAIARLQELRPGAGKIGREANALLAAGLKSKDPAVRAQARATKRLLEAAIKPNTKPAGQAAVTGLTTQLNAGKGPVGSAAYQLGQRIAQRILAAIQANAQNRPNAGGKGARGKAGGGYVQAGQPYIVGEYQRELFVPETSGTIVPHIPESVASGGRGGDTYQITVPVTAQPQARTPADIARELRVASKLGYIGRRPRPSEG